MISPCPTARTASKRAGRSTSSEIVQGEHRADQGHARPDRAAQREGHPRAFPHRPRPALPLHDRPRFRHRGASSRSATSACTGIRISQNPARAIHLRRVCRPHPRLRRQARQPERAPGQRRHALRDGRPPRHRGDHGRAAAGRAGQRAPARLLAGLLHRGPDARGDVQPTRPWATRFT